MSTTADLGMLAAALEVMPVAALVVEPGADGVLIRYVNPALAQAAGVPRGALEGRPLAAWLEAGAAPEAPRADDRLRWRDGGTLRLVALAGPSALWLGLLEPAAGSGVAIVRDDVLTGLRSPAWFAETAARELAAARRRQQPAALLLADLDAFAAYNDVFGRAGGDACLRQVARAVGHCFRRATDVVARADGDAFAALAVGMEEVQALAHAATVRDRVRLLALHHPRSTIARHLTVSVGVALLPAGALATLDATLAAAREALAAARGEGGDATALRRVEG